MDAETKKRVEQLSTHGWSQRAIADEVGVSRGAVWRALRASREQVVDAELDDEFSESVGLVGGLLVLGVVVAIVLISAWLDSRRARPPRTLPANRQHRPSRAEAPPPQANG